MPHFMVNANISELSNHDPFMIVAAQYKHLYTYMGEHRINRNAPSVAVARNITTNSVITLPLHQKVLIKGPTLFRNEGWKPVAEVAPKNASDHRGNRILLWYPDYTFEPGIIHNGNVVSLTGDYSFIYWTETLPSPAPCPICGGLPQITFNPMYDCIEIVCAGNTEPGSEILTSTPRHRVNASQTHLKDAIDIWNQRHEWNVHWTKNIADFDGDVYIHKHTHG